MADQATRNPGADSCSTCAFWIGGHCHRAAPTPGSLTTQLLADALALLLTVQAQHASAQGRAAADEFLASRAHTHWPETAADEWCGEWANQATGTQ